MIFKRTAAGIILAGLMLGMTGCGSTGNDGATENTDETSLIEKTDGGEESASEAESGSEEAESADYKTYDVKSEWSEVEPHEGYVQIDDVLYPGSEISADEFIKLVDSSEVDYEYDYDSSKTLEPDASESIIVNRNGQKWFSAEFENQTDEKITLGEVTQVKITPAAEGAMKYSRFIDGTSYDDFVRMNHDECVDYFKNLEEKFPCSGFIFSDNNSDLQVSVIGVSKLENSSAGNYDITSQRVCASFSYDSETKKCSSFYGVSPLQRLETKVLPTEQMTDNINEWGQEEPEGKKYTIQYSEIRCSDLPPEGQEKAEEIIKAAISENVSDAASMEKVNDYFMAVPYKDGKKGLYLAIKGGVMYELTMNDGSKKYIGYQWYPDSPVNKNAGYYTQVFGSIKEVFDYERQDTMSAGFYIFED